MRHKFLTTIFSFVCRADCIEVAAEDALCGKGYELTLFLFTDIMVVAKRKSTKGMSMMRSPSTASLAAGQQHMLQNKVSYKQSINFCK